MFIVHIHHLLCEIFSQPWNCQSLNSNRDNLRPDKPLSAQARAAF
jgi:hypothetical protein